MHASTRSGHGRLFAASRACLSVLSRCISGLRFSPAQNNLIAIFLALSGTATAGTINYCVYDPSGAQGDYFAMAKDYQLAAKRWGVNLSLLPYNSETLAVEDFKAGQCDMIGMTGLRMRLFNQFAGTIDAPGAIEDYAEDRVVMGLLASPKLAPYLVAGDYEVVGAYPLGSGYDYVNDRKLNKMASFAGKRIAVMGWDETEAIMVEQFGAQPVLSDITNFGTRFNNGQVDVLIAPIQLYKPFELYKGLGDKGGIIHRAILQISMQQLVRRSKFPPSFAQQSRDYVASTVDHALGVIRNAENEVDPRHWLYMNTAERNDLYKTLRGSRAYLERRGFYDKRMLNILKRVRCKSMVGDAECSEGDE